MKRSIITVGAVAACLLGGVRSALAIPVPPNAPVKPTPIKPKPPVKAYIICSPIAWTPVNLAAGHNWFGSDVPGMREVEPTDAELTAMLKKYGFETQYRKVDGKGGSSRLTLFARLTRETKTAYTDTKREGVRREVGAIADMVYGGQKAIERKVKSVAP